MKAPSAPQRAQSASPNVHVSVSIAMLLVKVSAKHAFKGIIKVFIDYIN